MATARDRDGQTGWWGALRRHRSAPREDREARSGRVLCLALHRPLRCQHSRGRYGAQGLLFRVSVRGARRIFP
jgi:hypothetical protein